MAKENTSFANSDVIEQAAKELFEKLHVESLLKNYPGSSYGTNAPRGMDLSSISTIVLGQTFARIEPLVRHHLVHHDESPARASPAESRDLRHPYGANV
jgi:hypothetical protein